MPTKTVTRPEAKLVLLRSLLKKPKLLHFGRCPVDAIELAMEMSQEGFITIHADGWVHLTYAGRVYVAENG